MNFTRLRQIIDNHLDYSLPFEVTSCKSIDGYIENETISINEYVILPVKHISSGIRKDFDIQIKNEIGIEIGHLVFTKILDEIEINSLTEYRFIAYLYECENITDTYKFKHDYVIIKEVFIHDYINKYYNTSSIWGGFIHENLEIDINTTYEKSISYITAIDNIILGETPFVENALRAVMQAHAFERYLKFYHLIELNFDYDLIKEIQDLDLVNNSNKIGILLNNYNVDEFERLTSVLKKRITNISPILPFMKNIFSFKPKAIEIFYSFGKKSNPLRDINDFNNLEGAISFNYSDIKIILRHLSNEDQYNSFIFKLLSYWIYRIRCCIAHNRIGEYVMSKQDEEFIVEFAEPLLKQILIECFRSNI